MPSSGNPVVLSDWGLCRFDAAAVKERIAHAQHVFINECGHLPWVEQSEVFVEHVQRFLASTGDEGSVL